VEELLQTLRRKILCLAIIFNSIISLTSAINTLVSFYAGAQKWHPYSPYLLSCSLFWFVGLLAGLNIFSAKLIGKAHMRRILFHHYVYGFMVSSTVLVLILIFAPASVILLLKPALGLKTAGLQSLFVYIGLFFAYGGLTLVIDDFNDLPLRIGRAFDKLRLRISSLDWAFQAVQVGSSLVSIYVASCVLLWYLKHTYWMTAAPLRNLSYLIFMLNLVVTCLWGLNASKGKLWTRIFSQSSTNLSVKQVRTP
jgi:hypothetical protein